MKIDNTKPTLRDRLQATELLLEEEADALADSIEETDLELTREALLAGWRRVMQIKARACMGAMLEERANRQP